MRRIGRRGEAVTLVLVGVAVAALVFAAVPQLNPFRLFGAAHTDSAAGKESSSFSKQSLTPVILSSPQTPGQAVVAYQQTYETGEAVKTPRLTLGQRIGRFFSGLTLWGVVFVIVSLAFFGGAPIVWLWRKYATMKAAFKNTVSAIRETDDETFAKIKPHLAAKQDKRDKRIVDKLKSELH